MGRLESLSAWALGRGHYEEEVIQDIDNLDPQSTQQYSSRGYPRNPVTKQMEKENVRAANEVMQTTGVVEDAEVAKSKLLEAQKQKNYDTLTGLELLDRGRAVLVGGVWGVIGLRRRILLYRPYANTSLLGNLRHEAAMKSMPSLIWSGLPTAVAYHVYDWVAFWADTVLDRVIDEEQGPLSPRLQSFKSGLQIFMDITFYYVTLHFRLFAILQQLNLIPSSRLLPSLRSFIPFSATSPLDFPPLPTTHWRSFLGFGSALIRTAAPLLIILVHGRVKHLVSRFAYRPIYKCLPRPIGDSMFDGLAINPPTMLYDTPDRPCDGEETCRLEDGPTLRALEGHQVPPQSPPMSRPREPENNAPMSDTEEEDQTPTTLISFDVEATEPQENTTGSWSAELRSAQEPATTVGTKYRITGLTMLPVIMATEGLRDIVASILVMPLEAVMVRIIGRAYRASAGLATGDMYGVNGWISLGAQNQENLFSVLALHVTITGLVWVGFIVGSQWYVEAGKKEPLEEKPS